MSRYDLYHRIKTLEKEMHFKQLPIVNVEYLSGRIGKFEGTPPAEIILNDRYLIKRIYGSEFAEMLDTIYLHPAPNRDFKDFE